MKTFKKTALTLILINSAFFAQAENITLFAAASLQNAIDEIKEQYAEQDHPTQINTLYDSSSNLARQIEQGAPADLFISANQSWMDYLESKQLIDDSTRKNIVKNELALVTYRDNPRQYQVSFSAPSFWDSALKNTRIALGDPDHVPAGLYAKESFEKLGIWELIQPQIAPAQNVRAALLLVEVQEADLGVVYSSDANISQKVRTVAIFPEDLHEPIEYPIAITKDHANDSVTHFYDYLLSDKAATIFKKYGFATP